MRIILLIIFVFLNAGSPARADHLIDTQKALEKVYKDATRFEERYLTLTDDMQKSVAESADISFDDQQSVQLVVYDAYRQDQLIGTAYEDTVIGKWGPIHYLVGLDSEGTVQETVILDYDEIRGKPVAKRRFLKQYRKKTVEDPVELRRDIDGVSGATISSRSLTDGVRKILHIHHITLKRGKKKPAP